MPKTKSDYYLHLLIEIFVFLSPVFFLTIKGWMNSIVFILFFLCLSALYMHNEKSTVVISSELQRNSKKIIILSLTIGFLTILITQTIRWEIDLKAYDAPLRSLLCIPIFIYLCKNPIKNISDKLTYSLLISIIVTWAFIVSFPETSLMWGEDRLATTFSDPNAFGTYITCLTALLFIQFSPNEFGENWGRGIIKLFGIFIGAYLIFRSGTRGAWICLPFIFLFWLAINLKKNSKGTLQILFILLSIFFISYFLVHNLQGRIASGFSEAYSWFYTDNKDTSLGIRLSMWKIVFELFSRHPFLGFGNTGYQSLLTTEYFKNNYSPIVIEMISKNGPHNEYLANLLRSGIIGITSSLLIFLAPLYVFMMKKSIKTNNVPSLGIALIICLSLSAISIEVLTLKYTISFYSLMIALLASDTINKYPHDQ